jgi:hypothetical protein
MWIREATRDHLRSRRMRVWMSVLIAATGVMAFLPLFNLLDFALSFVMAILASVASLDLGCAYWRRLRDTRPDAGEADERGTGAPLRLVTGAATRAALCNLSLLVAPLLLICANGLRVRNCDWLFGFKAYVFMPGLSVVAASAAGMLVGMVFARRRWLASLMPFAVFLLVVVYSVWRFYAAPPVFVYNMFAGYFPGNLYDETVDLRAPFYWARLYHFALLSTLLCLAALCLDLRSMTLSARPGLVAWRARAAGAAMILAVITGWLHAGSGALGFDIDAADIQRHLGGRHDTEHFVIYYPPGGDIERDIHAIAEDHEFRYAQVARLLGAQPQGTITSFYFADASDKYRMMGAGRVYMAKPWRNEIYLQHQLFPHQVLRHEIAHVIAGVFGSPIFKVSADTWLGLPVIFNPGLIEGTAVAADWPDHFTRELTPHQSVKAMLEMGMAPPPDRVLSTGFLAMSSARSYTLAGSFVRYVLDTYGAEKLRQLYRTGGRFGEVYGKSQADMVREWRAMIDAIELPPRTAEIVRERFRRPGIFARPCPHAIARQHTEMAQNLARGDIAGAVALARRVCAQAPHEPGYRMQLADLLVRGGHVDEAAAIYQAVADNESDMSSTLRAHSLVALAGMAARTADWNQVTAILRRAADLPLGDDERRLIEAQLVAATHAGPARAPLRQYFWGYDPRWGTTSLVLLGRAAAIIVAEPDLGLGHYLLGRNMTGQGVPGDAARALARSLDLGLPSPSFAREAARLLAESAYLAGDHALVERAAEILIQPGQPTVAQLYGTDWLERLYWKRTGTLPDPR